MRSFISQQTILSFSAFKLLDRLCSL